MRRGKEGRREGEREEGRENKTKVAGSKRGKRKAAIAKKLVTESLIYV